MAHFPGDEHLIPFNDYRVTVYRVYIFQVDEETSIALDEVGAVDALLGVFQRGILCEVS